MTDALGFFILAAATGVCTAALFVVLAGLFPRRVERTARIAAEMPGRSLIIGLINSLFFAAVIVGLLAADQALGIQLLTFPALFLLAAVLTGMVTGLAGLAALVGRRSIPDSSPLRQRLFGSAALYLACLTPFVGWFGLLPYVAVLSLGALLLGFFTPRGVSRASEA